MLYTLSNYKIKLTYKIIIMKINKIPNTSHQLTALFKGSDEPLPMWTCVRAQQQLIIMFYWLQELVEIF